MKKQLALQLRKREQLVTAWCGLGKASRQELVQGFASLMAKIAKAELGLTERKGSDEQSDR